MKSFVRANFQVGLCLLYFLVSQLHGQGIKFVSNVDTPGSARTLVLANSLAYVADDSGGLQIVDVSQISQPVIKGSFSTIALAKDVAVKNSTAYLALMGESVVPNIGGIAVVDVTKASSPTLITFIPSSAGLGDYGVAIDKNRLLVTGANGNSDPFFSRLSLFDVSNPREPILKDHFPLGRETGRIAIKNNSAAVAHVETGVRIFDLNQQGVLRMQGIHYTGNVSDTAFIGTHVVYSSAVEYFRVSTRAAGVQILGLNKHTITPRAGYYTRESVLGLDAQDPFIVVANGNDGVLVLKALSLDEIVLKARFNTPGTARDVVFKPPYIFVADGEAGLTILRYDGPAPEVPANVAVLDNHTISSRLLPGETVNASVTYINLGSMNWTAPNYKLLLRNPSPLWQETTPRINIPAATLIRPDDEYTFNFKLKAPMTDGTYTLEFSMIEEFVQSFGTPLKVSVAVGAAAATQWELYQ